PRSPLFTSTTLFRSLLDLVQRLEESGVLKTLAEMAELLDRIKWAWTGSMAAAAAERAGKAIEAADDLVQKGYPELVDGVLTAVESAREELRDTGGSPSLFRLLKTDRKSTRLNSSHVKISYAVFCLKKK